METLITEMERYAVEHDIPIMQKAGIEFFQELIQKEGIQTILELGTAIGYSAIQLARLSPDIHIVSIERDEVRYQKAVENVEKSGLASQITLLLADALECEVKGSFDCIFIDAAKAQYIKFFERYAPLLNHTGCIVSDNLKFHGYVEDSSLPMSRNLRQLVKKIRRYINYLQQLEDYETVFYDLGDGVAVTKVKK